MSGDNKSIRLKIFDALDEPIAVINARGIIVDVNAAWKKFGFDNSMPIGYRHIGQNY